MIQSKKIVGATILYLALSAGFAFAWRVELPRFPVTFVEWALLLVGALPASLAIELPGADCSKPLTTRPAPNAGKFGSAGPCWPCRLLRSQRFACRLRKSCNRPERLKSARSGRPRRAATSPESIEHEGANLFVTE